MIELKKRRKSVVISWYKLSYYQMDINNKFIDFDKKQLESIIKCDYLEHYIRNNIISNIPFNIKKIKFDSYFNQDIQLFLHTQIIMLEFGFDFNKPINNLPIELNLLKLGSKFNHPVNNLPLKINTLIFGSNFNQPIDLLPNSIKVLVLSGDFNQDISNLPLGLKVLRLTGCEFNFSIDSSPNSIEILELNPKYRIEINKLPTNLNMIQLGEIKYNYSSDLEKIKKKLKLSNETTNEIIIN